MTAHDGQSLIRVLLRSSLNVGSHICRRESAMFGFGRSAQEKAVINLFALQLESLGIPSAEAVGNATKLVDEVLSDIRPRGIDPFKATQGNELAKTEQFVAPRLAAGLTIEDIRAHWNRPLLVVLSEVKMREMVNFIVVRV